MPHALLVDDDPESLEALGYLVEAEGFEVSKAPDLSEALRLLAACRPDVVITDLMLPDGRGLDLLESIEPPADPEVVLVTGHASLETAVEALRGGVSDYLTKPVDVHRLRTVLGHVRRTRELRGEVDVLRQELRQLGRFGRLVGSSPCMNQLYDVIARVAPSNATVLITGESGVGKDLVAQTVHDLSRRRGKQFVPVNCGAVSPNLIESQLFGHDKGSFTGADEMHRGYFEQASGGTLFLDEIAEMPLELQVKLLRVLETGLVTRLGGERPIEVDVRIVAATNRDLEVETKEGRFREDLLYRLNVFGVEIPPLRERGDDIVALAEHYVAVTTQAEGKRARLSQDAIEALLAHNWPGNVRELANALQRAVILADGVVTAEHLPEQIRRKPSGSDAAGPDPKRVEMLSMPIGTSVADAERILVLATLEQLDGNKPKAAEVLGISLKTLYNRLNAYQG